MPSIDENSNKMNGHGSKIVELSITTTCSCCPFGYHIDRDFVPFSKKMLSREGDVQKIEELKEKWRSERQSMDKLLGIPTEPWEITTLSRPSHDMYSPYIPRKFDTRLKVCLVNIGVNTGKFSNESSASTIATQTDADAVKEDVGIQLNLDLESPLYAKRSSGSLGRRKRERTFETGIQVNESELLNKEPPPPLLVGVERIDFGAQADLGEISPVETRKIPKLMKSIGVSVRPFTTNFGSQFKPVTRNESSSTVKQIMHHKNVGTGPHFIDSGDAPKVDRLPKVCLVNIGVNTEMVLMESLEKKINEMALDAKDKTSTQTEGSEKEDVGTQLSVDLETNGPVVPLTQTKSLESMSRTPLPRRGHGQHPTNSKFKLWSGDHTISENSVSSKSFSKPPFMRSNTYTKEISVDEDEESSGGDRLSPIERTDEMTSLVEPKYVPIPSIDLSIPTILENRESVKPSKEMLAALKVLNDALLRGKTTDNVTSAIKIILHEWFRISGSKSASALDVEDYLDLFESYSPELLKYIVNMPDGNGNSAIHYAVSHGNFDVVSVLLNSNCCDINRANKAGYTCIMLLSLAKLEAETDRHIVCRLCNMGDVNIKAMQHGQTALMLASSQGHLETCKILLQAGADINIQDDDGSTALMCAAEHGHADLVNYFVSLDDCDLEIKDNDGSTALNVAMDASHKDIGVTLYAHMHFIETSPKVLRRRRLSYPPGSPGGGGKIYPRASPDQNLDPPLYLAVAGSSEFSKENRGDRSPDQGSKESRDEDGGGESSSPTTEDV